MNESDFLREQLAAERAHFREILGAVRAGDAAVSHSRPVALYLYIEWAQRRLVTQLHAHQTALQALPAVAAETRSQLAVVAAALAALGDAHPPQPTAAQAEQLLALIDAWNEPLERLVGQTLRTGHWRQAAHLTADTILEERQLYAAARGAVGLS
jgi:hypothetical protein